MRVWGFAALAIILAGSASARMPDVPEAHVLLLDRSLLKSDTPALDNSFEISVHTIESQIMAQHQANLILDKSAFAEASDGVDVTAEAVEALKRAVPGWTPQAPVPTKGAPSGPVPPAHLIVVDSTRLRSFGTDAERSHALDKLAASRHADFILRRDAVVIGLPGLDMTARVANSAVEADVPVPETDAPVARIAILDRQGLLQNSAVGKSIAAQVRTLTRKAVDELRPENAALKEEGELLQQEAADIPSDEKERRMADFKQRQYAFALKVQKRQNQIRMAVALAQRRVEQVAGPIVQQITKDSGANMVVDRMAVVVGDNALDMTALATEKLNAAMPTIDLTLPPAD